MRLHFWRLYFCGRVSLHVKFTKLSWHPLIISCHCPSVQRKSQPRSPQWVAASAQFQGGVRRSDTFTRIKESGCHRQPNLSIVAPFPVFFRQLQSFIIGLSLRSLTAKTTLELFILPWPLLPRFHFSYQNVITNHRRATCICSVHYQSCPMLLFSLLRRESLCLLCKNAWTRDKQQRCVMLVFVLDEGECFLIPALACWLSAAWKWRLL